MGIDGNKGADFLNRGKDDGNKGSRDISSEDLKRACDPWSQDTWKLGPIKQGSSPPRYAPKGDAGTKPPSAASASGKYAKAGGRGKGFGS